MSSPAWPRRASRRYVNPTEGCADLFEQQLPELKELRCSWLVLSCARPSVPTMCFARCPVHVASYRFGGCFFFSACCCLWHPVACHPAPVRSCDPPPAGAWLAAACCRFAESLVTAFASVEQYPMRRSSRSIQRHAALACPFARNFAMRANRFAWVRVVREAMGSGSDGVEGTSFRSASDAASPCRSFSAAPPRRSSRCQPIRQRPRSVRGCPLQPAIIRM